MSNGRSAGPKFRLFGIVSAQKKGHTVLRVRWSALAEADEIYSGIESSDGPDTAGHTGVAAVALEVLNMSRGSEHGGKVAARRAASGADAIGVDVEFCRVGTDPANGSLGVLQSGRKFSFAGEAVLDARSRESLGGHVRGLALERRLASIPPPASMDVDHRRKRTSAGSREKQVELHFAAPVTGVDHVAAQLYAVGQMERRILLRGQLRDHGKRCGQGGGVFHTKSPLACSC